MDAKKRILSWTRALVVLSVFFLSGLALLVTAVVAFVLTLPDVRKLETCFTTSMFEVKLCPGSAHYVRLKEISPYVLHAVIAAEDGAFYTHKGFDWHEMQESFSENLRSGKFRRGGSTLTQQLAKNVFLSQEKSLWRKIKEAYLAHAIEAHYPKDLILEKYLNVVEFGPKLFGIKAAAEHYFQLAPSRLNPLQAAYLAHLLPNPKVYSRSFAKGELTPFSRKMVTTILKRMSAFGKLSPEGYALAKAELPAFPWIGLSIDTFKNAPNYSFDDATFSSQPESSTSDEEALEELLNEDAELHRSDDAL